MQLASFYDRHMALVDGTAWAWSGNAPPARQRSGVRQVGVSQDACFALLDSGALVTWQHDVDDARMLMRGVAAFRAGQSGWFAIDHAQGLWHAAAGAAPVRVAGDVVDACIGDSADYYVTASGALHVKGLAHRGQYGDGRLTATPGYVATARGVASVKAHTGHAICLRRDGVVLGTGGNRFGPLGAHGLGDKADAWGPIFEGAAAIATGARHSLALRADGTLWAWGEGFAIEPHCIQHHVVAVAAGDTATLYCTADGRRWQRDAGGEAHELPLR